MPCRDFFFISPEMARNVGSNPALDTISPLFGCLSHDTGVMTRILHKLPAASLGSICTTALPYVCNHKQEVAYAVVDVNHLN